MWILQELILKVKANSRCNERKS